MSETINVDRKTVEWMRQEIEAMAHRCARRMNERSCDTAERIVNFKAHVRCVNAARSLDILLNTEAA